MVTKTSASSSSSNMQSYTPSRIYTSPYTSPLPSSSYDSSYRSTSRSSKPSRYRPTSSYNVTQYGSTYGTTSQYGTSSVFGTLPSRKTARISSSVDRELGSTAPFKTAYPEHFEKTEVPITGTRRCRVSYSVDRELGPSGIYGRGRNIFTRGASIDRDFDIDANATLIRARSRSATRLPSSRSSSVDRTLTRARTPTSMLGTTASAHRYTRRSPLDYTLDDDLDYNVSRLPHKHAHRASSVSRYVASTTNDYEPSVTARNARASSVTRYINESNQEIYTVGKPRVRAASLPPEPVRPAPAYGGPHRLITYQDSPAARNVVLETSTIPDDEVQVTVLPSGEKAVSVTRVQQKGHGDAVEANEAIERIVQKTNFLEKSISSLEEFVRRNRSLFPEETTIYQQVCFFQLNEEQLRKIGERPNAEVYGVKIKEKLVVPYGCEVTDILNRHYGKSSDVEIEYSGKGSNAQEERPGRERHRLTLADHKARIRKQVNEETDLDYRRIQQNARKQAEVDYERIHRARTPTFSEPSKKRTKRDDLNFSYTGLDYDSLYEARSQRSSDLRSDRDSTYTKSSVPSSRRKPSTEQAPEFTSKLRSKRCIEGSTVRFNCSVSGRPKPDIEWYHGTKPVTPDSRIMLTNNYGLLSLEIAKVKVDDAGVYSVKATNSDGEATTSAPLDVEDIEPEKSDGTRKPYFVADAQNTFAEVGQKASMEVQASGRPVPTFKWQKDNINLEAGDRVTMFSDESGNAKLVVKDIQHTDAGLYFCIAENSTGKAKCAATLRVVDHGQLTAERQKRRSSSRSREVTPVQSFSSERTPRSKGLKPYFIQTPPSEVDVHLGDPLTIKCVVDGTPKPKVLWQKGARDVTYSKRVRVVVDGTNHMMEMKSTIQTDPGQYVVSVENTEGRVQASIWVNMLPPREDEHEPMEIVRTRMEYPEVDYEVVKETEESKMAPRFVKKLPLTKQVSPGDNLEMSCTVKEAPHSEHTSVRVQRKVTGEYKVKDVKLREGPDGKFHEVEDEKAPEPAEDEPMEAEPTEPAEKKPAEEEKSPEPMKEEVVEEEKVPKKEKAPEPAPEEPAEKEKSPEPVAEKPEEMEVEEEEVPAEEAPIQEEKAPKKEKAPEPVKEKPAEEEKAPEPEKAPEQTEEVPIEEEKVAKKEKAPEKEEAKPEPVPVKESPAEEDKIEPAKEAPVEERAPEKEKAPEEPKKKKVPTATLR